MEAFLFVCLLIVLVVRWFQMRDRLAIIEARLDSLTEAVFPPPAPVFAPAPPPPPPPLADLVGQAVPVPPAKSAVPIPWTDRAPEPEPVSSAAAPSRTSEEWEALLGGSWMNKLGVFSTRLGPRSVVTRMAGKINKAK